MRKNYCITEHIHCRGSRLETNCEQLKHLEYNTEYIGEYVIEDGTSITNIVNSVNGVITAVTDIKMLENAIRVITVYFTIDE
jgi:hypothetical protein